MSVLITGGAGFIGSTIATQCVENDIGVVVLDDYSTGLPQFTNGRSSYAGQVGDRVLLDRIFAEHPDIDCVIHCAARIVVPESVSDPLGYYENNVGQAIALLNACVGAGIENFIFSSSGSIYSEEAGSEFTETSLIAPKSPYSKTKEVVEDLIRYATAGCGMRAISLRYFNPIGADPKFRTGLQTLHPTHALGNILRAFANDDAFTVTGTDWPTRDGSGIRDYIHVWDLADAHVRVVQQFDQLLRGERYDVFNIGTGRGTTVFELVAAANRVLPRPVQVEPGPRRPGDVVGGFASVHKFADQAGWAAQYSIEEGIAASLEWAEKLPSVLADSAYAPDA
ncbi:MAG: UDP-glucose 4-epimerase GalE [Micrococcales bacterium]|nr:UDP-glucose 4-epimerase GalE [Micrococcales bacterium]